jgi:4-amino-4-deoxy-L-arabinose transferase-like glycosyltransferase
VWVFGDDRQHWLKGIPVLGGIWFLGAASDRLWFALDHAIPAWDPADYLTGALIYWKALQTPQWFSGSWWTDFWQLSSKIPPLVYISTSPFLSFFGLGADQSSLVLLLYSGILLAAVYLLGSFLFNMRVALWAAGLCVLMPAMYRSRLEFLLDYPLAAMVTLCFASLTIWRSSGQRRGGEKVESVSETETVEETNLEGSKNLLQPKDSWLFIVRRSPFAFSRLPCLRLPAVFRRSPFLLRLSPLLPWFLVALFGITLGFALMTKQTAALFLLVPILWLTGECIWQGQWGRLAQLGFGILCSLPIWLPWYRTNWLLILTSSKRATIDSAIAEGSPPLWSLDAWTLYLRQLPGMASWPVVVIALVGLVCFWRRSRIGNQWLDNRDYVPIPRMDREREYWASRRIFTWLLVFMVGGYVLSSLNPNKDDRYVVPYLPVFSVMLAYGLTLLPRSWRLVRWGTVSLASVFMIATLFPIFAGAIPSSQSDARFNFPYTGTPYPHEQVIEEVIRTAPYLRSTIGVLPSTPTINQHNFNYYGLLKNLQVYGRQVGTRKSQVFQDRRSLAWFLTKTASQGSIRNTEAQTTIVKAVEQGKDFKLDKTWPLPDRSLLKLYHRRVLPVEVKPIANPETEATPSLPLRLEQVTVPEQAPPGKPIPVTYQWSGRWDALQSGLMVLTWKRQSFAPELNQDLIQDSNQNSIQDSLQNSTPALSQPSLQSSKPASKEQGSQRWFHDHAIAKGELYPDVPWQKQRSSHFQVIERMAMLPSGNTTPGIYALEATYINRQTGQSIQIPVPETALEITPNAAPTLAPELDLVTQLRNLAHTLPQGTKALSRISDEINRINQYDPVQDYLVQVQQATHYRLQQEPENRQFAYTLALATVLKRQVGPAIAALDRITQLDPRNPFAYAYLAFVNLYDFRPQSAQRALDKALAINPKSPEIQALNGIAALMRGNLVQAWQALQAYQQAEKKG